MNPTKAPLNRQVQLDDKYTIQTGRAYMTGIEALVRLPMLQQQRDQQRGLNTAGFISGYRGSPLGGVDQSLWQARDFLKSQNFVNKVGDIAEKEGHHPDISFGWGYAEVKIFTHKINGLVESDFILAAKIDKILY